MTQWQRFLGWLKFAFVLAIAMIVIQAIAKIPERWDTPDQHWFTGNDSLASFLLLRAVFVVAFSLIAASLASFSKQKPPWAEAGPKQQ